ncbi:hypothetical protein [Tardiphaga sp. vice278]|uniref:hypothetical protein n=1 Tax=Tardiphaga sp. vice278 TaxID=2592815 RepID=UPI001161D581|nr:hypothetical protein [Tardiphaga sp. vice278]QDM17560.1 hypothetical protein FNL53_17630 [Tardiphaga sp. vice278]
MRIGALFVVLGIAVATPASAQVCVGSFTDRSVASEAINVSQKWIASAAMPIETVPISDAKFIDLEERAALDQQSLGRYDLIRSHRFFAARQIERANKEIKDNLEAAKLEPRLQERAILFSASLSKFNDLSDAFNQYIAFDGNRPRPVLVKGAAHEIGYDLTMLRSSLLRNLQCTIRSLKEP